MGPTAPTKHHLDRRIETLISAPGGEDDLLDTRQVADWLGVSMQWVEIGRSQGYGPPFRKISTRMIRYLRSDVLAWLRKRKVYSRTSDARSA